MRAQTLLQQPLVAGLIALLVCILTGQGMLHNMVLCLGDDGHVAVEASAGPGQTCAASPAAGAPQHGQVECLSSSALSRLHCGPCQDVSLSPTDGLYVRSYPADPKSARTELSAQSALPVLVATSVLKPGRRPCAPPRGPAFTSAPLHLRSTLLLI